jgi:hypothetical protein
MCPHAQLSTATSHVPPSVCSNHEGAYCTKHYGFFAEVMAKYGTAGKVGTAACSAVACCGCSCVILSGCHTANAQLQMLLQACLELQNAASHAAVSLWLLLKNIFAAHSSAHRSTFFCM